MLHDSMQYFSKLHEKYESTFNRINFIVVSSIFRTLPVKNVFKHLGTRLEFSLIFLVNDFFFFQISIRPMYYRDAHAAALVFDITDEDSFERVR